MSSTKVLFASFIILILSVSVIAQLEKQQKNSNQKLKSTSLRLIQKQGPLFSFNANQQVRVDVVKKIKRDMLFFVEGFAFISNNLILESTGLENQTEIHLIDLDDMSIKNSYTFDPEIFGEGSAMIKDSKTGKNVVFMMTYKNNIVYKMDENLTEILEQYPLPSEMQEGWGMHKLSDDTIIATDGSSRLFHINPENFTVKQVVRVTDSQGYPVVNLNELEIIDGKVYCNIFTSKKIVVFDPFTGKVQQTLDFTPLVQFLESEDGYRQYASYNNVLNGIAYNPETKQTLITGKNWPYIYEVKFIQTS
ncbi:hypothetical protein ABPG72_000047 [Tetrahymena utriculariae]